MRNDNRYFDIYPKIVRAGRETTITIRPLFDHVRAAIATPEVTLYPAEGGRAQTAQMPPVTLAPTEMDGVLQVRHHFECEQEYTLLIGNREKPLAETRLYALDDDLFTRRPYKGDLHIHSYRSDGKESPAYVAGAGRRIGLDFMAITDHRQYAPSLEAIRAFENIPIDLRLYPGEEVHPPENPVHIINFGGSFSVNDLFKGEAYRREVQAIADTLTDFPPDMDRYPYAACVWCFDKIREGGGLAIFCHPYWYTRHRYDVPEALTTLLLDRQPYDALELIGGYHPFEFESNMLQVARYHDERARGKSIPIVGVSDAHGCETGELFGWYYTIVFAPSPDLPDLVENVKSLYSVAVEALPGQTPRAHGPFRLVKYAQFLLREVLPLHDALCIEEGRLMLAHIAGDPSALDLLRMDQGRTATLYNHLWGEA
ncbi:MAG TPA: hypothetical protein PLJ78_17665 [Anaerolineae bacterium]|nr:hypothetical protein [Anaerolineae bacterium]HQK15760.1 hypothetical protein [Anaerolineae bacterium]